MTTHPLLIASFSCASVPLSGLGFRWAGGLLSQWASRDLGNFLPRQVWGLTAALPMLPLLLVTEAPWYVKVIVFVCASFLTGLMRGFGWGGSLSLGFSKIGGPTDGTTWRKLATMFYCILAMLSPVFAAEVLLLKIGFRDPPLGLWLAGVSGYVGAAFFSTMSYYVAWRVKPFDMPFLGCLANDPPPTGEILTGAWSAYWLTWYGYLVCAIAVGKASHGG